MARENVVNLIGRVSSPMISIIEETQTFKIAFTLTTLRGNGRLDFPRVVVYGLSEQRAKRCYTQLKDGVFAAVRGMVSTRMMRKEVKCQKCGNVRDINVLVTEIIAFDIPAVLPGEKDAEKFCELCNNVQVLGEVCSTVVSPKPTVTMYQLCVERRFNVKEQKGVDRDYPWIKSFGENGFSDGGHLHPHSCVYINGSFQTRKTTNIVHCINEGCDGEEKFENVVGEIVVRNNEYLHNCFFEDRRPIAQQRALEAEAKKAEKAAIDAGILK